MIDPVSKEVDLDLYDWLLKESFSHRYGWLPCVVDDMDARSVLIYSKIIQGLGRRQKDDLNKLKRR